jgi:ABC-2 type transport system permease protein
MLNPLGTMIVLSIAFSQVFGIVERYPAYILSGLMAWNFFSQTTNASMVNLVWGGGLLKRIYMPRTSFAISAVGTGLVNLILSLVPLVIVMLATGMRIRWTVVFLPLPILCLIMFSLGFGLILSAFAVYFPDVAEMYNIGITAWMYLTPIIYPISILPDLARKLITTLNPMYSIVNLFRIPIYDGRIPTLSEVLIPLGISTVFLIVGWWFFANRSDEFAYRI